MDSLLDQVVAFVAKELAVRADLLNPETTLLGDLGVDGDDGDELLSEFGRRFGVDMSTCKPGLYFGPEGVAPWFLLNWLVQAFRRGTPEDRARLRPIRIIDLVRSAERGRWVSDEPSEALP